MPEYDLSIIIVSYNSCSLIVKCIESIYKFSENLKIQIIISDNASSDNTVDTIEKKYHDVYIIKNNRNLGFAKANNGAIKYCKGRFVLFLNPDITLIEPVFKKMIKFLETNDDAGLVGCKLINPDGSIQKSFFETFPTLTNRFLDAIYVEKLVNKYSHHDKINDDSRKVAGITGACMLLRKNLIDELGGFDESFFMYCEDVDLSFRVKQMGYNIYYLEDIAILHHLGASGKKRKRSYFEKVLTKESVYRFFIKHHGRAKAVLYRFLMIIGSILRLTILFSLVPITQILGVSYGFNYSNSVSKYMRVVSWGLGFEKWTKSPD